MGIGERVAELIAGGSPRARRVPKGHGHECWLVEGEDRPLMAKLSLRGATELSMANLAEALRLAELAEVQSPRLLWSGPAAAELGGRPMLIQEFLSGLDGEEGLPLLTDAERRAYFHDWGEAVGRLHRFTVGGFSNSISDPGRTLGSWPELVEERLGRLVPANLVAAEVSASRVQAAAAWIRSAAGALEVRPSLVHCDLYPPNTLLEDHRFKALLDFEHAKFMDPVYDFVKLEMWVFEPNPDARQPFWSGYGDPPEDFELRLQVCLALELLAGLPYWKRHGDSEMLLDFRRRFEILVV